MPVSKNRRKKNKKKRAHGSAEGASGGGGSLLSMRSTMKRAAGAVSGKPAKASTRSSGPWSTVITVAALVALAVVIYVRFLRG